MYKLIFLVLFIPCIVFSESNIVSELTQENFEKKCDEANILLYSWKREESFKIYENMLNTYGTNFMQTHTYENLSGMYLYYEAAMYKHWNSYYREYNDNIKIAKEYAELARKAGYDCYANAYNPQRFSELLGNLGMIIEIVNSGTSNDNHQATYETYEEALKVWGYFCHNTVEIYRRIQILNLYDPQKNLEIARYLIDKAPYVAQALCKEAGWSCIVNKSYREAFKFWIIGFADSEPSIFYDIQAVQYPLECVEYATIDELQQLTKLAGVCAVKFINIPQNHQQILNWLKLQNVYKEFLNYEIELRSLNQNSEEYAELLKKITGDSQRTFQLNNYPIYYIRANDYNNALKCYINRLLYFTHSSVNLMEYNLYSIEKYIDYADQNTFKECISAMERNQENLLRSGYWKNHTNLNNLKFSHEQKIANLIKKYENKFNAKYEKQN